VSARTSVVGQRPQSEAAGVASVARNGAGRPVIRYFARRPVAVVAAAVLILATLVAVAPRLFTGQDPLEANFASRFGSVSAGHPLGTDDLGRDTYSRLIHGTRPSLLVAVGSVLIAMVLGVPMGLVAGYLGGLIEVVLMHIADAVLSFPPMILALGIAAALGPAPANLAIAIAVVYIPRFARIVRGPTLGLRRAEFIQAVRASGATDGRVVFRHILPNLVPHITVQFSFTVAFAFLYEAGLSFLGLGVQPPNASWGFMLRSSFRFFLTYPRDTIVVGLAIFVVVLALNVFGDALRDLVDPRRTPGAVDER
jgi:peptide/nickel transport system permease protein